MVGLLDDKKESSAVFYQSVGAGSSRESLAKKFEDIAG